MCSILTSVRRTAARLPTHPALVQANLVVSYGDLMTRVNGLAESLRERGIGAGHIVTILLPRSPELIIAILGVLASGAAYVPLDPNSPTDLLSSIIDDCQPVVLITDQYGKALAFSAGVDILYPSDWGVEGPPVVAVEQGTAYIIYTSGSTGRPKGVVIHHRSLRNYLSWAMTELPFNGGGVPLLASIAFDHAVTCYFPALMMGEPLILLPDLEGGRALAPNLLTGRHYSYVKITPSHARLLSKEQRAMLGCCTDLLMFGGEHLTSDLVSDVRRDNLQLPIINHYGPTEATVGCCIYRIPLDFEGSSVPIGQPLKGVKVCVRREDQSLASPGEVGELFLGGLALADSYHHQPEQTEASFVELPDELHGSERWFRTGDLVRVGTLGELEYIGRSDSRVKLLGHRIELTVIELELRRHSLVKDAVILHLQEDSESKLFAVCTALEFSTALGDELREFLRLSLPQVMIPAQVLVWESLPLTTNGKIDRQAILQRLSEQRRPSRNLGMEDSLTAYFSDVLDVTVVGLDDDFFELGGDSLATMEIISWSRKEYEVQLEAAALFTYPTVRLFAEHLRSLMCLYDQGDGTESPDQQCSDGGES